MLLRTIEIFGSKHKIKYEMIPIRLLMLNRVLGMKLTNARINRRQISRLYY